MVSKENFRKINDYLWEAPKNFQPDMRVPARIYISEEMLAKVEERALQQLVNTAALPGIVKYAIAMPDIHSGYGPPIGGVGATELPEGAISPGFVGFDQNCGCRLLLSDRLIGDIKPYLEQIASEIQQTVPSGLGKGRASKLGIKEIDNILEKGVPYLVEQGYGEEDDIERCEERGQMQNADTACVSDYAKNRGRNQLGTLGSGNHFCEIQKVAEIFDKETAQAFGLFENQVVIMVHSGSRGLGHQNCSDYLKIAKNAADKYKIKLPDKELACMPFNSPEGQRFFQAMSAACNFAWANRHMIAFYVRKAWQKGLGKEHKLKLLYDVAHNIAKKERHSVEGEEKQLLVHRKGATRAFPPQHPEMPEIYKKTGQPIIIPGSMGTSSYVCAGIESSKDAWHTVNHGAGRTMSRHAARRDIQGEKIIEQLKLKGIIVKSHSRKGVAEEAPVSYKNIEDVVNVAHQAGLAKKVARLIPLAVIKGE